jgi:cyclic pyranopterin phosphate synthase
MDMTPSSRFPGAFPSPGVLADSLGRAVRYLRLSVTDRCNLRCLYCTHALGLTFIPHERILAYEEMLSLIDMAVDLGVDKVRLTGGEPFVRKGFMTFLENIRKRHATLDLRVTTNATLLAPLATRLRDIGVNCMNISLDTFSPATFANITGRNEFEAAYAGVLAALGAGLRIKLNAVALKGVNDAELPAFLDFARAHPVDVRFIEYMPLGGRVRWTEANFWPATAILDEARKYAALTPVAASSSGLNGPARMYSIEGGKGRFGLITPLSNHFCGSCNRLRITADGCARPCLFSDSDYPFLDMLRDPARGIPAVRQTLFKALHDKPEGYKLLRDRKNKAAVIERDMSSIGG